MAVRLQPFEPTGRLSLQMLIAGLAADSKLLTQLGHRKARTLRQHHKSNNLFHWAYIFPRHCAKSVTHHPGSFVAYLSGSYQWFIIRSVERLVGQRAKFVGNVLPIVM